MRAQVLVATVLASLLVGPSALAQQRSFAQADEAVYGALELKFGGYTPSIDSEFSGATPFADFYGDGMFFFETEVDVYVYDGFGRFGFGLHGGITRERAEVQSSEDVGSIPGTTSFSVIPLRLSAVYRLDELQERYRIPLVPVVRAGLDYHIWRIRGAGGNTSEFSAAEGVTQRAAGAKFGWHAAAALHLSLDFIEPGNAAALQLNFGIDHSYLFAEVMLSQIDNFGQPGFDLGGTQTLFGLAFEF
ncbi:MAG: MXAN_2562 family outer membrane beta-barrel protein [Myxococcota bacterium]